MILKFLIDNGLIVILAYTSKNWERLIKLQIHIEV